MYGLTAILYGFFQVIAAGLLRALAPEAARTIFTSMLSGHGLQGMTTVVEEYGIMPTLAFLALASWPVFGVPFICWGAFRIRNQASRLQSAFVAALTLVLGVLAYAVTLFMSYASVGPG
jgi:cell shape-determining protein MreD